MFCLDDSNCLYMKELLAFCGGESFFSATEKSPQNAHFSIGHVFTDKRIILPASDVSLSKGKFA